MNRKVLALMITCVSLLPLGGSFAQNVILSCGFDNYAGTLATVPAGFYDGYDMVIFGGAASSGTIHANHWAALETAIQNKTSKAFIIEADNCCVAANKTSLITLLNNVFGTSYTVSETRVNTNPEIYTKNSSNNYSTQFPTNTLSGGVYYPML